MIPSWAFLIGLIVAWTNGATIGFLYCARRNRTSSYRVAKERFEEQRERVLADLKKARDSMTD